MGRSVTHVDIKPDLGVDIIADFTRLEDRARLRQVGARTVLCSNLLEHLSIAPVVAATELYALVPPGGYLVLTAPLHYGYHADPIDTMFRPTPDELVQLLPEAQVVKAEVVQCRRGAFYFAEQGSAWPKYAARILIPVIKPRNWWRVIRESMMHTSASCVLLHKPRESNDPQN